ncbi:MAG: phosphoribosylaminoimidazolesuccinocarboxamide synthase [Acidobacteria bacterium]|nr:phosphoribosylaminoimidazolesuccinocarboxamide synthase [Acidobacteriota bacterium]MBI3658001.1 phosphoribosylaminoimidazolesuccinocarboxamide synthase [Acidobacteriota bacterium]
MICLATHFEDLELHWQGKVRDIYKVDADTLLIVATDRISAFDYVLPTGIPCKGAVLNQLSQFWFEKLGHIVNNHLLSTNVEDFPACLQQYRSMLAGRSMWVRRTQAFDVECVVRGYLAGSGWKDYQRSQSICGIPLPAGLRESERLPEPIFTPSTKAEKGHDVNISFAEMCSIVGADHARRLREISLQLYREAADYAATRDLLIADTKFEFGLHNGDILWIDEALTPDSSRFWPRAGFQPGRSQPSFDKQYVRNYLETIHWNKQPPAPTLSEEVINGTSRRYRDAYRLLTGREIQNP